MSDTDKATATLRERQDDDRREFDGQIPTDDGLRVSDLGGYTNMGDDAEDAANLMAGAIMWCFNPPDDDGCQDELLADAVFAARDFIEAQPCRCERVDCGGDELEVDGPCDRCRVLGRIEDRFQSR